MKKSIGLNILFCLFLILGAAVSAGGARAHDVRQQQQNVGRVINTFYRECPDWSNSLAMLDLE